MAYGQILGQSFETSPVLDNYFTKDETLTSATAALFGLGADAVPDDVLEKARELISTAQSTANTANTTANSKAAIKYGSYTGKGTYGRSNKNSLTFTSTPRLIVIRSKVTDGTPNIGSTFIYPSTAAPFDIGSESATITVSWGTTVSWYHELGASFQLNVAGERYYYAALL